MAGNDGDGGDESMVAAWAEQVHWDMFRIASAVRRREYAQASEKSELTLTQCSILYALRAGPIRLGDLATHEGVRAPTMTIAISRLEGLGMVTRRRDPGDKRLLWIEATPKGLHAQRMAVARTVDEILAVFSADELRLLHEALGPLERLAMVAERVRVDDDAPVTSDAT